MGSARQGRDNDTFVGRGPERAVLDEVLQGAIRGEGAVVVLVGEPGVGKTCLADLASRRAAEVGLRVHWAQCWEWGGAPAFWPWVQLIRSLARDAQPEHLSEWLGQERGSVARLDPQLLETAGDVDQSPAGAPARFVLFDAATWFLRRAAATAPILLVIDDLHGADLASLHLLRFLAREIRGIPLVVLATCRSVDLEADPETQELLDELRRHVTHLELGGLEADDLGVFVEQITGEPPSQTTIDALLQASGGNPLFLDGLVRALAVDDGFARFERGAYAIPSGVRGAIERRLQSYAGVPQEVLAAAAVIGRGCTARLVARVSDVPIAEVSQVLRKATAEGLMTTVEGPGGAHAFTHALIAETIRRDLDMTVRLSLHHRCAEALEELYPGDEEHLAQLAHHYLEWAALGDVDKGIEYARRAAAWSINICAYEDAARYCERALDAMDFGGPAQGAARCELLLDQGEALLLAGRRSARDQWARAAAMARTLARPDLFARAALGVERACVLWGSPDTVAQDLLEEALTMLGPEPTPLRVRALARLAASCWTEAARSTQRDEMSRAAVEQARSLEDDALVAAALGARLQAIWDPALLDERLRCAAELATLVEGARDKTLVLEAHRWRMNGFWEKGETARADAELVEYARIADALRWPQAQVGAALRRVVQRELAGDLDGLEEAVAALHALAHRSEDPLAEGYRAVGLLVARRERGDADSIATDLDVIRDTARAIPSMPEVQTALLDALMTVGQDAEARQLYARLVADGFAAIPRGYGTVAALAKLAEVCVAYRDEACAAQLYDQLLPYADQAAVAGLAASCGAVARYLGLLAGFLGRIDVARTHFEAAVELNRRMGARGWLAHTLRDYADLLRASDPARADTLADEARALADALGFTVLAARLGDGGATHTAAPDTACLEAQLQREGDYWTVAFGGVTSRVKHNRGLDYIALLIAADGQELLALQLASDGADEAGVGDPGDAGPVLDAAAKAAYRARLQALREKLEEAESWNDPGRATRAREEMEAIASQLIEGVGLGGRDRRAASARERARVAVTRAIKRAIQKIEADNPALGHHLRNAIRTGAYCAYDPEPAARVAWRV
jgi:tetratricopeptide (TPR) repeat protein